ncbi:MAG: hypothetical protein ACRBN8_44355 [Nannocystales bacterium]
MATKLLREDLLLDSQVVVTVLSAPLGDPLERTAEAVFGGLAAHGRLALP